ncbi:MAG: acetyl-CoA carboxylase biotin carboxylase subunit [Gemmatimonadales bacterium]|nr:acetyl-CoA carboxylase biotin carboxylase subunit [Gemmatimonadales bacterium]MDZ4390544.1 acetyl-CoA carboxylase biotin carboxylase subunit [Gemmatimonadales bacterium]
MTTPITRVLVANRGEIAVRIIRACHDEGLEAVAVYSDADRHAPFVRLADHAVRLGPAPSSESYLRIDAILAAAQATGAEAIHPGYGFLSERAPFARAIEEAGLVFVGPPSSAIEAMGDKTSARRLMQAAGVPIVPGAVTALTAPEAALPIAAEIGYPVLVKAAAGGGGKGMRVVRAPEELVAAVGSASSEALRSFGDGSVYLERFVERPRHVEIQVLADHQRTIHVGERECSVQRRHQKVVEEAPSVAVDPALRERMGAAAVAAAEAVGYRGAGTCEFLLAESGEFFFLEMNTRIQVEHPVTELVYGVDLVREQLRIARGLPMTVPAGPLEPGGWAIECRITSEDSANGLLPSAGVIRSLVVPTGEGVRWDSGVVAGSEVTLFYDSMLAKLIVHAADRASAIARMRDALDRLLVVGVATNVAFQRRLLAHPDFVSGAIDIQFLDRHPELLAPVEVESPPLAVALAAILLEERRRADRRAAGEAAAARPSRWGAAARSSGPA